LISSYHGFTIFDKGNHIFYQFPKLFSIFALSNETETGSAGEQPVRDKFDE